MFLFSILRHAVCALGSVSARMCQTSYELSFDGSFLDKSGLAGYLVGFSHCIPISQCKPLGLSSIDFSGLKPHQHCQSSKVNSQQCHQNHPMVSYIQSHQIPEDKTWVHLQTGSLMLESFLTNVNLTIFGHPWNQAKISFIYRETSYPTRAKFCQTIPSKNGTSRRFAGNCS